MKKSIAAFCLSTIFLLLTACSFQADGDVSGVKVTLGASSIFTEAEVKSASDCVLKKFENFKGCKLTDLWYDENNRMISQDIEDANGSKIILLSNFDTITAGPDQGFNENSTYTDWCWILTRENANEEWVVKDYGVY